MSSLPLRLRLAGCFGCLLGALLPHNVEALTSAETWPAPILPAPTPASVVEHAARSVVAVAVMRPGEDRRVSLCSGALVEPNLLLTARHCISRNLTATPRCDRTGRSHNGDHLGADIDPAQIAVYTGDHIDVSRDTARAHAVETLHGKGRVLCDADIAYIVLDKPLVGVELLRVRNVESVGRGDSVVAVGYGGGAAERTGILAARGPHPIIDTGPYADAMTGKVLGPREFEVAGASCAGDSGGPVIDVSRGDVVGVASRGSGCTVTGNHVYTRTDAFRELTAEARTAALARR